MLYWLVMEIVFKRIADRVSLDFHNTASWAGDDVVGDEALKSFPDIVLWCREAGLLEATQSDDLVKASLDHPVRAEEVVAEARRIRGTIHLLFGAVADDCPVPEAAVESLNGMLARLPLRLQSDKGDGLFEWDWQVDSEHIDGILWPVIWDAATLLRDRDALQRVKSCAGARCGWLFLDTSRRGNRRWCDMADCGNRAKVRRFHERHGRGGRGA